MKKLGLIALVLCFALFTSALAFAETDTSVTVTDMTGREVTLDKPATRIVALTPSDCEILYAIGAGDTLVGRGKYCDYPAEVLNVTAVQSGRDTNLEEIIALEPQVLLMSTMAQTEEQVQALENAGIKVVVSDAQDIEGVYTAIELIGKLMGKDAEAAAVIESMKATFAEVAEKASENAGKTVYFEVSPLQYGLWTAGKGTFMNEIANMQVIARNPDYIVTISMYYGEGPTPVEEILGRKGWEELTAIKNQAVLNLANNELSRPAPRLADGAKMLYDFINTEVVDKAA